jgi:hypothetical protein
MTLAEFRLSKKWHDNVNDVLGDEGVAPGYVYDHPDWGGVFIELSELGGWWTLAFNRQFMAADLHEVEDWLYRELARG